MYNLKEDNNLENVPGFSARFQFNVELNTI